MKKDLDAHSTDIEALLARERVLVPQSEEVRRRAFARARTAMAGTSTRPRPFERFFELRWALVAGAVLLAATMSAAAIRAHRKAGVSESPFASLPRPTSGTTNAPVRAVGEAGGSQSALSEVAPSDVPPAPDTDTMAHARALGAEGYVLELTVLEPARAAIVRGEFAKALGAIAEHERRFARGQLAEEREAMRVQSLTGLHRTDEARRAAAAFRKRFPRSVLLPRMNETLQTKP